MSQTLQDMINVANQNLAVTAAYIGKLRQEADYYRKLAQRYIEASVKREDIRSKYDPVYRALRFVANGWMSSMTANQFYDLSGLSRPTDEPARVDLVNRVAQVAEELELDVSTTLHDCLCTGGGGRIIVRGAVSTLEEVEEG